MMPALETIYKLNKDISLLYVEDDVSHQKETADFLKEIFPAVDVANDGAEGLELFQKTKHNLIITDLKMPKMSGQELIKEIKKTELHCKIVVTTAYSDQKMLLDAIDLGVDGFVTKPIDMERFILLLEKMVLILHNENEIKLLKERQELEFYEREKLRSMQELLSNISHHWRQPLTAIAMMSDEILEETTTEEQKSRCLAIQKEVKFLSHTLHSLRELAIIDGKKSTFDLCVALKELENLLLPRLESINTNLIITCEALEVTTRKADLKRVLHGLITNSIEAIESKQSEKSEHKGAIRLEAKKTSGKIEISLYDNGCGISKEIQSRIFEPYFTTKFPSRGVGLSLYLFWQITKKELDGELLLDKSSSEGSTFKVIL